MGSSRRGGGTSSFIGHRCAAATPAGIAHQVPGPQLRAALAATTASSSTSRVRNGICRIHGKSRACNSGQIVLDHPVFSQLTKGARAGRRGPPHCGPVLRDQADSRGRFNDFSSFGASAAEDIVAALQQPALGICGLEDSDCRQYARRVRHRAAFFCTAGESCKSPPVENAGRMGVGSG